MSQYNEIFPVLGQKTKNGTSLVLYRAESRGVLKLDWITSKMTFSFAHYYNPVRMGFGAIRAINEDHLAAGKGHSARHIKDMEMILIPLSGALSYRDSEGTSRILEPGDIQLVSAGTGIFMTELNASATDPVNYLKIWVYPKMKNLEPTYQKLTFKNSLIKNNFLTLVSPEGENNSLIINQNAYLSYIDLEKGREIQYSKKSIENGLYIFVLSGTCILDDIHINALDGVGLKQNNRIDLLAKEDCQFLVIEMPI
jgi:redox-sensitive bicupin YhaK (pirin superfamily)